MTPDKLDALLAAIRQAFDSNDIAFKNIMLRKAYDALREAEARERALREENALLREKIAHIHNRVRHELSAEIDAAVTKAFQAMAGFDAIRQANAARAEKEKIK